MPVTRKIHLTAKQVRVILLLLEGHTVVLIAKEMGICQRSVKLHLHNICAKFGITSRFIKQVRLIYLLHHPELIYASAPAIKFVNSTSHFQVTC